MAKPTEEPGASGIPVIARAAEILRALGSAPDGLTQADVADRVGLARSTIHRLLRALEEEGLVEAAEPRGRYRLGPCATPCSPGPSGSSANSPTRRVRHAGQPARPADPSRSRSLRGKV